MVHLLTRVIFEDLARFNKFSVAGIMFRGSKHLLQQLSREEVVYIAWFNPDNQIVYNKCRVSGL